MEENNNLKIFEDKNIRVAWNENEENWYFSVVDVVSVLTDSNYQKSRNYWKWLKNKLKEEGSELVSNTNQLKMKAIDGKLRDTDVMNTEQILRLIQSIPSKKAEPFKLWLAQVGRERIDEAYDPEIAINRALDTYRRKGYSEEWINQRLKTIDIRKEFTDELKRTGITESKDFAILTNILTQVWSGYSVKEYKKLKGLKKGNLRDNMTNMELVLNMLAETSSTEISKSKNTEGFEEAKDSVIKGGNIARIAKEQLEKETGKKIVSSKNAKEIRKLNSGDIEGN
ncbi:MAG: Bro-N domain-containing protein [Clostridia bacterium]|nr:Bro-N domain-containing protein [Clostridia bacterium]